MAGDALATAYLELVPSMQGAERTIIDQVVPGAEQAGEQAGSMFGSKFTGVLAAGAVAGGVVAGFKGLYDVGAIFDDVSDTIRVGTGATGDALLGLEGVARQVATNIPTSFEAAGQTVADLNTRLGLTGGQLETVASQYLEAGRMLGEEIDVQATTAAFSAFGIEGANVSGAMDTLFQVSQATGVSMNQLASSVQGQAPALQAMGFSFENAAALVGGLDKAGVNAQAVMAGLGKGLVNMAKDGEAPEATFQRVTGEIQALIASGDQAGAIDLASGIFGTRGATQFVAAVESGQLALGDLMSGLGATGDTILGVGAETMDFAEQFQLLKNNALEALEPLGSAVFSGLGEAMGSVTEAIKGIDMESVSALAAGLGDSIGAIFSALAPHIGPLVEGFATLLTTVDPIGAVFAVLGPILTALMPVLGQLAADLGGALGGALAAIAPPLGQVAGVLAGMLGQAIVAVLPVVTQLVGILGPILGSVLSALAPALGTVGEVFGVILQAAMPLVSAVLSLVTPFLGLLEPIAQLAGALLVPLVGLLQVILEPVLGLATGLAQFLQPAIQFVADVLGVVIGWVSQAVTWFTSLLAGQQDLGAGLEGVWAGIGAFLTGALAGLGTMLSDWGTGIATWWNDLWAGAGALIESTWNGFVVGIQVWAMDIYVTILTWIAQVQASWSAFWGGLVGFVSDTWNSIVASISSGIDQAVAFVLGLPGQVEQVFTDLISNALGWGESLMQGFIDGITAMTAPITDAVGGVLGAVADFFPHSPAKRGPFSGSGYTSHSGSALVEDFAAGMRGSGSEVVKAAEAITASAALSGTVSTVGAGAMSTSGAAGLAAGTGPSMHFEIHAEEKSARQIAAEVRDELNYGLRSVL